MTDHGAATGRQTGLDGLRGLAVLLVVAFHAGLLEFGWLGVSLFFVLSGHLITRVLLSRPDDTRRTRVRDFVRNRVLRLAPLYLLCCTAITVGAVSTGYVPVLHDLPALWTWTYNLRPLSAGFAQLPNDYDVYAPMWSLGAEVQIYLLWALVALLLPRHWFRRLVVVLALTGPLARLLVAVALWTGGVPDEMMLLALYAQPVTYLDAFALGACTALPELRPGFARCTRFALPAALVVLAVVVGHAVLTSGRVPADLGFPVLLTERGGWLWQYGFAALVFAVAVHHAGEDTRFRRVLSVRPLMRVGVISYSMYLLHTPVLWLFIEVWFPPPAPWSPAGLAVAAAAFVVVLVVSEISYRCVEAPFLRRKRRSLLESSGDRV
jgi:peptidoglycan/LPS O-acetylase OafA/YrhL